MSARSLPPGRKVTRRNVYIEVAIQRRKDSEVLFNGARYLASIYMAGYVIECYLKMLVCARRGVYHLNDYSPELTKGTKGHALEWLVEEAGLTQVIRKRSDLYPQFRIVNEWNVSLRYEPKNLTKSDAERFRVAMESVYAWLLHRPYEGGKP